MDNASKKTINIAFLVLCHDEEELLGRLSKFLLYGEDKVFVHVDRKVDINKFKNAVVGLKNVCFTENRFDVYWGGFNSVKATMELIKTALNDNVYFDRFVLLQGRDYPLHSPEYMHNFFLSRRNEEFCKGSNVTKSKNPQDYMKCCGWWNRDRTTNFFSKIANKFFAFLNTKVCIKYRRGYFKTRTLKWDVFKGWAQISLTRECALFVLNTYEKMPRYNKFMKHRFPPDEIYIHTIIYNSRFRERISSFYLIPKANASWFDSALNLTYFEYPSKVVIFKDLSEYDELLKTKALFIRKVSSKDSRLLLDEIDYRTSIRNANSTSFL